MTTPPTPELLQRLKSARQGMLHLHKALLDAERVRYEQIYGPVQSNGQLLQLVIGDPWFTWLQPITKLVVAIDEAMEADPPFSGTGAQQYLDEMSLLLALHPNGDEFQQRLYTLAHDEPAILALHRDVQQKVNGG